MEAPPTNAVSAPDAGPPKPVNRRTNAFVAGGILAGLAAGLALEPVVRQGGTVLALGGWRLPTTCWFRITTGMPCASCGVTRAVVLLLHGRWAESWVAHPFGAPTLALILLALPPRVAGAFGARPRWVKSWNRVWGWAIAATLLLMLAWWTVRLIAAWRGGGLLA